MLKQFWQKFDTAMDALDEALDKEDFFTESVSIQESNGVTVINKSGKIEIKGLVKSLIVNGKKVSFD